MSPQAANLFEVNLGVGFEDDDEPEEFDVESIYRATQPQLPASQLRAGGADHLECKLSSESGFFGGRGNRFLNVDNGVLFTEWERHLAFRPARWDLFSRWRVTAGPHLNR